MKPLIDRPEDLSPTTPWSATKWAWTAEEALVDHQTKARLCSAVLLPFRAGRPDCDVVSVPVTDMDHQESQTECGLYVNHSLPRTFNKILIANRGEIACRVVSSTCMQPCVVGVCTLLVQHISMCSRALSRSCFVVLHSVTL